LADLLGDIAIRHVVPLIVRRWFIRVAVSSVDSGIVSRARTVLTRGFLGQQKAGTQERASYQNPSNS
jgi:hypothetical protein